MESRLKASKKMGRGNQNGIWKKSRVMLDILINDIDKMEIPPRKSWITEAMIKKMEERRKAKTTNIRV